ncbi:MAG: YbaY family lipoprotein, partial [Parvularculaceae bacterium]
MRDPMIAIALCALCVTACSRRSDDARTPAAPTPIQADIANATAHDETSPAEEPGAAAQLVVRGTLLAEHDVALPSDAALRIQIRDVSMVDVAARILARDEMPIERLPAEFNISAPRAAIAPNARIAIFAQVFSGDRLLYMTTTHTPVDTQTPMNVRLQQISAVRDEAGGPVAGGAGAVGRSAIGAGADGSGADGMMITPPQDRFDCGGEALLVAIEAGG